MRLSRLTALVVLALSALPVGLSAQTTRLELGKTIQDDLSGEQKHSYSITLETNQYLRVDVTQPVATVFVGLFAPDGKKMLEADTGTSQASRNRIVWVTEAVGEYRISVSVPGKTVDARHYEIKLEELRPAGADDRKHVEAQRLFMQGLSEGRKYAYDQAIVSYTRALALYREVQDRVREADALYALGAASYNLSQSEKAIGYYEQALVTLRETKDRGGEGVALKNACRSLRT